MPLSWEGLRDCKQQLDQAFLELVREGKGAIIYLQQEGRGIGLANKIHAYQIQDTTGADTVDANHVLGETARSLLFLLGAASTPQLNAISCQR